jgi:glycosyltransferase involved in cell wall biosynthesis
VALEPDLLLLQWWTSYWLGLYTVVARRARAAHIPILTFAHQFVEPDSSFLEWFVTRRALRHTDGLVVMSEEDVGMARRVLPGKTVRLGPMPALHVPEGDRIPRAEARARLGLDPTASLLLFFGFVRRYKGLKHLLEALSRVPDVQLLVAGEFWENEDTYRAQVCRLDLGDRVMLVNRYIRNEEVELYFGAADALVLPYVSASQSAVGATALAFGLPLIATRVGGLQELVVDGATGLMVAPGSSEQLADAIARFFRDRLGERFREAIAGEHRALGWETLVRTIEEAAAEITTSAPSAEGAP